MVALPLWTIGVQLHKFAGPIVMLVYPLYASVKAIESPYKEDDQQWLTYWILYSFVSLLEMAAGGIFAWIPMWYTIKLIAACWLALPQFHGAAYVYDEYVKKHIRVDVKALEEKMNPQQRKFLQIMSPEARVSVANYISDYGDDAFDKVIKAAHHEAKKHTSPSRSPPTIVKSVARTDRAQSEPVSRSIRAPVVPAVTKSNTIRNYCRQQRQHLKASLHQLEIHRKDFSTKLRVNFVDDM